MGREFFVPARTLIGVKLLITFLLLVRSQRLIHVIGHGILAGNISQLNGMTR